MNNFDFYSPTYFVFGRDRENEAGRYVKKFGGSRVMVVYGGQMDFDDPKRTAREGVEAFKNFLRELNMPLTFAEVGADPASIPRLVEMNNIGDGVTGGYVGLDRAAHFEIYETAAGLR